MHPQALVLDPSDPYGQAAALRARGPVTPVQLPGDVAAWAITHHATLTAVLNDPVTYAKDPANWTAWREGRIRSDWELISWIAAPNMLNTDGAQHRRLRDLASKAFTARQVTQLRPRVTAIADRLIDQMRQLDIPAVDLKASYALPLPLTVISELFGIPENDRGRPSRKATEVQAHDRSRLAERLARRAEPSPTAG